MHLLYVTSFGIHCTEFYHTGYQEFPNILLCDSNFYEIMNMVLVYKCPRIARINIAAFFIPDLLIQNSTSYLQIPFFLTASVINLLNTLEACKDKQSIHCYIVLYKVIFIKQIENTFLSSLVALIGLTSLLFSTALMVKALIVTRDGQWIERFKTRDQQS